MPRIRLKRETKSLFGFSEPERRLYWRGLPNATPWGSRNGRSLDRGSATLSVVPFWLRPIAAIAVVAVFLIILEIGLLRRRPSETWEWDWNHFEDRNRRPGARRFLILQEAGPGPVADIMEVTSKLNRAYAREWGHDYVRFTGILMGNEPWHSTFNKAHLLRTLLEAKDKSSTVPAERRIPSYDVVMMLSVDAVIVDLDYDVGEMFTKNKMIGINGDDLSVIFWNLNHLDVRGLAKQWVKQAEKSFGLTTGDGDEILIDLLKSAHAGTVHRIKPPLVDSFAGEVIKHFRQPARGAERKNDWLRKDPELVISALQQTVDAVCYQFYPKCEVI